jgi:2,5-furandicarboxylate decarboxylase 1
LRSFLTELRNAGELASISDTVDPRFEVAAILEKAEQEERPAIYFEKVKGYSVPIVSGLYSSENRTAMAVHTALRGDVPRKINQAIEHPIMPVLSTSGQVKKEIQLKDIDVLKFPIPTQGEKDAGPYITAGVTIAKDPDTGRRNLSYHRMQVTGKNKLRTCMNPFGHLMDFYKRQESRDKPLDVAICIGAEPEIEIAASLRVNQDEIGIAGGLLGKPVELVRCETVDVEVPSNAEIVLEGKILPKVREQEGPAREIMGGYGSGMAPIVEITGVLNREHPIYRTILSGSMEHSRLYTIGYEAYLSKLLPSITPCVKAVHIPAYTAGFLVVLSVEEKIDGEAASAIVSTLGSHPNSKLVVAVDRDADIYDARSVLGAMANEFVSRDQLLLIERAAAYREEPTSLDIGKTSKVGFDATRPTGGGEERSIIPGLDRVDLSKLLHKA